VDHWDGSIGSQTEVPRTLPCLLLSVGFREPELAQEWESGLARVREPQHHDDEPG
jgi:hypothetical protein